MRKFAVIFVFLFLSCLGNAIESAVQRADKLVAANRVEEAIVHYQRAIQQHPNEAVLYLNQAALFRDTEKYASALRNYEVAKHLQPDSLWPYIGMGRTYALQKKYPEALAVFTQAAEKFPDDGAPYFHLGTLYFAMGEGRLALENLDRALVKKYKNQHNVYYYRGRAFEELINNKARAKLDYQSYLTFPDGDKRADVTQRLDRLDDRKFEF